MLKTVFYPWSLSEKKNDIFDTKIPFILKNASNEFAI